jgi:hypothetical protein
MSLLLVLAAGAPARAAEFRDDFDTAHNYVTDGLGAYAGLLNGTVQVLDANTTSPGALYMQTAGASWEPGPGPLLYVEVTGDFVATVKVVDFAGTIEAPMLHNDAGIMARDPNNAAGENWVSVNFFPTWTAFIARTTVSGARAELGQTVGRWTGADTYALAAQYPYLQLERKGADFFFRISADGVDFVPLTDPAYQGIYDGNQAPLVVTRSDLPETLQIGLFNATYTADAGYVAIDDFSVVTPAGPSLKVIYVTSVKDNDQDGVQDDQSWIDWLTAQGYDVDARPGYWNDPLDANEIAELEAADLIIASRGMATGDYDGAETPKWNALSTPILNTNAWMIRNNRWKWLDSGSAVKDAGAPLMMVLETEHPIFAGVELDEDGLVEVLDPEVYSGHTSFLSNFLDPGNGTLLAQSLGIYNTAWIVEWPAGVEYYPGAGEIAGGKRLLFMAATQDDPYTVENGLIAPVGVFNLTEAGRQMLLNAIAYLTARGPIAVPAENLSFELPGTEKIKGWNGEGVAGTPAVDVPGWSSDSEVADSGVETGYGATDGEWTAFLMGADPSVWQLTDYVIDAEDVFELQVDARNTWQGTTLRIILFYDEEGIRIPVAFADVTVADAMQTFSLVFDAKEAPDAVGRRIGIEFDNVTAEGESWIGLDNVRLTDLEGR